MNSTDAQLSEFKRLAMGHVTQVCGCQCACMCVCAWGLGNAGAPMCDVSDAANGAAVRSCAAVARVQDKLG